MTETILASKQKHQPSIPVELKMVKSYKLDESVRLSLQVPKIKYSLGALPRSLALELCDVGPSIPCIVAGMSVSLAIEILEISLEAAVTKASAYPLI